MVVRITLLIKKLDSISDDEFHKYWAGPHAQIFMDIPIVKQKVLKFSQFHTNRYLSEKIASAGFKVSEFDGGVDIWVASMDDMIAITQDEEYRRKVFADAACFSKVEEGKVMIGHETAFIGEDGKISHTAPPSEA